MANVIYNNLYSNIRDNTISCFKSWKLFDYIMYSLNLCRAVHRA